VGLGNPLADQGDKPLDHWVSVLFAIEDTAFTRENVGKEWFGNNIPTQYGGRACKEADTNLLFDQA